MHPYLPHLIKDISAAYRTPSDYINIPITDEEDDKFHESIAEGGIETTKTISQFCGLEAINFPPASQFTLDELSTVTEEFGNMLSSWNIHLYFPHDLPMETAYNLSIATLDKVPLLSSNGFLSFHYCEDEPAECIYKEYCTCKRLEDDLDDDAELSEEDFGDEEEEDWDEELAAEDLDEIDLQDNNDIFGEFKDKQEDENDDLPF